MLFVKINIFLNCCFWVFKDFSLFFIVKFRLVFLFICCLIFGCIIWFIVCLIFVGLLENFFVIGIIWLVKFDNDSRFVLFELVFCWV